MTRSSSAFLADRVAQPKGAGGDDREHVFTQGLKAFCSHWQPSYAPDNHHLTVA
jgi:hypothetical protein